VQVVRSGWAEQNGRRYIGERGKLPHARWAFLWHLSPEDVEEQEPTPERLQDDVRKSKRIAPLTQEEELQPAH
jgi:hypothetical protein